MFIRPARAASAAALAAAVATSALALGSGPAAASTYHIVKPARLCFPASWYKITSVITRAGLVQLLPTVLEPNESNSTSTLGQTVTVTGSLIAGVTGNI